MAFKDRLKLLRNERGMTQEELANVLGLPASTIRRYESSEESIPKNERLQLIADYFDCTIDYLLERTETKTPQFNNDRRFIMSFAERLKLVREGMGLTQQQAADMVNIPRTTYSGYESSSANREPDFQTLILLSDCLDVSLDYLIKGVEHTKGNAFLDRQLISRLSEMEKEFDRIQQKLDERKSEIQDMKKLVNG